MCIILVLNAIPLSENCRGSFIKRVDVSSSGVTFIKSETEFFFIIGMFEVKLGAGALIKRRRSSKSTDVWGVSERTTKSAAHLVEEGCQNSLL